MAAPTKRDDATRALFKAIGDYSKHPEYRHAARERAALKDMRVALADGADWTVKLGPGNRDAAFAAAFCADRAPLELLLEHGVPLDHQVSGDGMLIHRAAYFGRVDIVRMFVERGVAPDAGREHYGTPLRHARSSKFGQPAVPVLIALMRKHGCTAAPARRGDDLLMPAMATALAAADIAASTRRALAKVIEAFFVEFEGGKIGDFLNNVSEQRDDEMLAAAVAVACSATTKRPQPKIVELKPSKKPKRFELVHHGDLEIRGDANGITLIVTGDLRVRGLLTNFEGCVICVGGDVRADAIWSEGPLVVAGDLTAKRVFAGAYDDYGTTVRGTLATPVLLQLDHVITAGKLRAGQRFTDRAKVPAKLAPGIAAALHLSKL